MTDLRHTKHAACRIQQRGYKQIDTAYLLEVSEQVGPNEFFLSDRRAEQLVREFKRRIATVERLRGSMVVADGATIVTVQRLKRTKPAPDWSLPFGHDNLWNALLQRAIPIAFFRQSSRATHAIGRIDR